MALDEEKILSREFIFISYSHKNADAVKEDVYYLLSKGVRVWFDVNMRVGDNWMEIAERVLHNKNCVGVIFYNSNYSFVSEACQKEQALTRELGLKYWSVNLDGKNTAGILFEAMSYMMQKYGASDAYFSKYATSVYIEQTKMFDERILCFLRSDSASVVQRIYDEIAVPYRVVDNEDNVLIGFQKGALTDKNTNEIKIGKYIGGEYVGPEQAKDMSDQRFGSKGDLIQLNRKRYTTRELYWKLMYVNDEGKAVLLCNRIIRQSAYYDGIKFMNEVFASLAFSEEEKQKFGDVTVRYMNEYDMKRCTDISVLELAEIGRLKHWWIDAKGLTENWKQTYSNNVRYENGFSCLIKKGIRPIIEISAEKIK